MNKAIEIMEEFTIPGTEVILEKGDKIRIIDESSSEYLYDMNKLKGKTRVDAVSDFIREHGGAENALRDLVDSWLSGQYYSAMAQYIGLE